MYPFMPLWVVMSIIPDLEGMLCVLRYSVCSNMSIGIGTTVHK